MNFGRRIRGAVESTAANARARRGYAPLPGGIDLLLTDACNLRCAYCPVSAELAAGRPAAMVDTASAIRFLESVA